MKRKALTLIGLALSMLMLAGCDLSSILELARPKPQAAIAMTVQVEPVGGEAVSAEQLQVTRQIIERRAKSFSVSANVKELKAGKLEIVLTGGSDTSSDIPALVQALSARGFIELLDGGDNPLPEGEVVITELGGPPANGPQPTSSKVWPVVVTSEDIDASKVQVQTSYDMPQVAFTLKESGAKKFADFTASHIGKYMPIVVDKKVISAPQIQGAITGGSGVINNVSLKDVHALAAQMRAGTLPVNLTALEIKTMEP